MLPLTLEFTISKADVFKEVEKLTAYIGAQNSDEHLYDRIATTDENSEMLDRFWEEAKNAVCLSLGRWLVRKSEIDGEFAFTLKVSGRFNDVIAQRMAKALFSFFAVGITSKWLALADGQLAAPYGEESVGYLASARKMLNLRVRPSRPQYS